MNFSQSTFDDHIDLLDCQKICSEFPDTGICQCLAWGLAVWFGNFGELSTLQSPRQTLVFKGVG